MKKDKKIVIATHGELANGFMSALKIIVGDISNITTICGYTSADFNLQATIESTMEAYNFEKDDVIVCTDMMGGSVNNGFVQYLPHYPFHLVTNIHLAFLVDLLLTQESITEELLIQKVNEDLFKIQYVNNVVSQCDDLDDF